MKKTIDELRIDFRKAQAALNAAEDERRDAVARPILRQSVGKCFKYSNTYGVSDGCRRWPLYCKVTGFDEKNMTFTTVQFQHTSRNNVQIEIERVWNFRGDNRLVPENGWEPIGNGEFERARKSILNTIKRVLA